MHLKIKTKILGLATFGILTAMSAVVAQETVRVRGTIDSVEGQTLKVTTREGSKVEIRLADNLAVAGVIKATLADIKEGSYVGIAGMPQEDGSQRALEVLILPEAMRGTGEGFRPWDLRPSSTMTNATVEKRVEKVDGHTLTLKYKDGEKNVVVPMDVPIVTYLPGDKAELKPGAKIFIFAAAKQPDGSLMAGRIAVGRDGLTPPM